MIVGAALPCVFFACWDMICVNSRGLTEANKQNTAKAASQSYDKKNKMMK